MPDRTIPRLFRQAVDAAAGNIWLLAGDETFTYAEALDRVERAASWLRAAGICPGDRVVITAASTAAHVFAWLALMECGAVQVPANPASAADELEGLVQQVKPKMLIADSGIEVGCLFEAEPDGRGPASVAEGDVAVMIPTSGTTGRSKLVMQSHLAYVMAAEGFPSWLGLDGDDRLMTSLPMFHINAPAYSVLGSAVARASLVVLPSFSASGFLDAARRYQATEFNSIGAMLEILMRQPAREDDTEHQIRLCYTGPSPERDRHLEIERRFGFEITCGYALSETPYGLVWRPGTRPYGTLGWPRQHPELGHVNDARVVDGELQLRNPALMRGYYEMPEETAAVITDGWLRTGDLVTENDDGTYTFIGRKKQVIRRRGENLSPTEVEAVLERHPSVAEAAVIGVPSALSEEDVKAFVVLAGVDERGEFDVDGLLAFAAQHLARFKVPRYVEIVDDLPHTPTGRLAKHLLPAERTGAEFDAERES